jgi:hypothetical protein
MSKQLIDKNGDVSELDSTFFERAKRGRPVMPSGTRRRRVNLMLEADIVNELKTVDNASALVNRLLHAHFCI